MTQKTNISSNPNCVSKPEELLNINQVTELGEINTRRATFLSINTLDTPNRIFDTYVHSLLAYELKNKRGFFKWSQLRIIAENYSISYRKLSASVFSLLRASIITKKGEVYHNQTIKKLGKRVKSFSGTFDEYQALICCAAYKQALWFFNAVKDNKILKTWNHSDKCRDKRVLAFKSGNEYAKWSRSESHGPCALSQIARILNISIVTAWQLTIKAEHFSLLHKKVNKRRCSPYCSYAFYNKHINSFQQYQSSTITLT